MHRLAALTFFIFLFSCSSEDTPEFASLEIRIIDAVYADSILRVDSVAVIPVQYSHVPDLSRLQIPEKKEMFISLMLPGLLISKMKRDSVRRMIEYIESRETLSQEDSLYYESVWTQLKAKDTLDLAKKLKTPPNSLALAQAAIESGWGTSRFFREGNNVYGVWSYRSSESRIAAEFSRGDKPIYLRKYSMISESVDDYYRLLSASRAYRRFRDVLAETDDPYQLADALVNYSELKHEYIRRLKMIIRSNQLTQYDSCFIHPDYIKGS